MSRLKAGFTAWALIASLGLVTAPGVFAKGHNQGATESPGTNVGSQTVGPAQGEGAEQGNGKGPADTPAGKAPGNSENAGRSGSESAGTSGGPTR
ncbi:MAG: hypothetical protein WD627_11545 [Actinomycetota bacterium]